MLKNNFKKFRRGIVGIDDFCNIDLKYFLGMYKTEEIVPTLVFRFINILNKNQNNFITN